MIEFPEEPRASSSGPNGAGRAAEPATEAELWLRRELAFLQRVERRILRRAHWRREAWRLVAVGSILAVFALCWYLAAAATGSPANNACPSKSSTTAAASAKGATGATGATGGAGDQGSTKQSATTSTTKAGSGTAASCGS